MKVTSTTKKTISHYTHENVGVRSNLMRMLGQGKLGGTGRMIILPVDQGFEHGPCLLYTSPSPRDQRGSRMPSSA